MNDSFLSESGNLPIISRRDISLIIVGGVISAYLGYYISFPSHLSSTLEFAHLLNITNAVGMTFASGLFSFMTAGLLFNSRTSRLYLKNRISEVGITSAYRIRVLYTLVITSIFIILLTIVGFILPMLIGTLNGYSVSFNYFAFLPAVIAATLIVSILLTSIASSVANFVDDSRLCTIIGSVSSLYIALFAGLHASSRVWNFSLTRNIALLSPHNIAKALAVQLSGYQFESTEDMVRYVGFVVSAGNLAIVLLIFSSIAIVLFLAGQKTLLKNTSRWTNLKGMIPKDEDWDASDSPEILQKITRFKRSLRVQRGLVTLTISILLVSFFVGGPLYRDAIIDSTTIYHYRTPGIMEDITVGSWIIFDVEMNPPLPGLFNMLFINLHLITLGNTSGTVSF
ncbi:MAG: hypothetical protein ACTSWQ_00755, partial [Candidatus Thorarchaeota archaeon]